jgi:nitroreductase
MDIFKAITTRRSVFPAEYKEGEISIDDLKKIIDSARWAPTHKKTEPWRFKVVIKEHLTSLADFMLDQFEKAEGKTPTFKLKKLKQKMEASAAIILIFMERDEKEIIPEWEEIAATSMAVQNIWLTSHAMGYGGYWSSPKAYANMKEWPAIEVGERERFLGFFYLGNYDRSLDKPQPDRKGLVEIAQFV